MWIGSLKLNEWLKSASWNRLEHISESDALVVAVQQKKRSHKTLYENLSNAHNKV